MELPSGITSVDTLQVRPGSEAFVSGQMLLEEYVPSPEDIFLPSGNVNFSASVAEPLAEKWSDAPVNAGVMIFSILLILLYMRKFMVISRYLFGGFVRWKLIAELEHNMQMARLRDSMMFPAFVIFCTILARFSAFIPAPLEAFSPERKTLCVFGLFAALLIIRVLLILIAPTKRMGLGRDAVTISNGAGRDFFIMMAAALSAVLLVGTLMPGREALMTDIARYLLLALWLVFILRKMQILSADAGLLRAFLYLCTVEIPPAAMLVVSMLIL
ncbi:MAG: hypothetical protein ACI3Z0_00200 [Candidatus Cryptobacteroides sp.]